MDTYDIIHCVFGSNNEMCNIQNNATSDDDDDDDDGWRIQFKSSAKKSIEATIRSFVACTLRIAICVLPSVCLLQVC